MSLGGLVELRGEEGCSSRRRVVSTAGAFARRRCCGSSLEADYAQRNGLAWDGI